MAGRPGRGLVALMRQEAGYTNRTFILAKAGV